MHGLYKARASTLLTYLQIKVFLSPLVRPAHVSRCQAVAADITNSEKKTGLVRISGALVHTGNTGLHSGGKLDQRLGSRDCLEESLCV